MLPIGATGTQEAEGTKKTLWATPLFNVVQPETPSYVNSIFTQLNGASASTAANV